MPVPRGKAGVEKVMHEFKQKSLHSGKGGPIVRSRKQAIAIALSASGMSRRGRKRKRSAHGEALRNMRG